MRERHLHTDDYPFAFFKIDSTTGLPSPLESGGSYSANVFGEFYIHGVRRSLVASLEIELPANDTLSEIRVRASFSINLDDYKIPRPKALFLKLAETIEVKVIFAVFKDLPIETEALPEWKFLE